MRKLKAWMEPRYTKIAIYTIVTALIIFGACLIIYNCDEAFKGAFSIAQAITKPLVLGLVIAYVLHPLVEILERRVFGRLPGKRLRRNLSVLLIFAIIALALAAGITVLIITVTKSVSAVSISDMQAYLVYLQDQFADFWEVIEAKLADFNINLGSVGHAAAGIFSNVKNAGSTLLFAVIFAIYFLLDSGISKYWKKSRGLS